MRRLNASFVGQVHRVLWEGGHIVALLRGMHGSTELRMRIKHDVLTVQVLLLLPAVFRIRSWQNLTACLCASFPHSHRQFAQFLEWRAALYRVLNADAFVFMIGLREVISARVGDVYDHLVARHTLDADRDAPPLGVVLDLLHVVALAAAHFFHENCADVEALLRQCGDECARALVPGAHTPLPTVR